MRPLLTRAQLERLNGGPLPPLRVTVWKPRALGMTRFSSAAQVREFFGRPHALEELFEGAEPVLFLPISEQERRRRELEEKLERSRDFLRRSSDPAPAKRRLAAMLTTPTNWGAGPKLETP